MAPITERMVRSRAEHNEGRVATLEEVSLHQQNIEKIELLNQACRQLRILYLQNNVIGKLQNLHRLKRLEYLNVALNNLRRVENLQGLESLQKLDLTMNFIDRAGLLSLHSLRRNEGLRDLYMVGNPCCDWPGWRPFVVGTLPHVRRLDGQDVKPSERIRAAQDLPGLTAELRAALEAEGVDPDRAGEVEDDSLDADGEPVDEAYVGEDGETYRPYTPATRLLEAREAAAEEEAAAEKKREEHRKLLEGDRPAGERERRAGFDELRPGEAVLNKNEGKQEFTLREAADGRSIVLDVAVGKFMDTSLLECDVQPRFVRVLVKGKLLQLTLEEEVAPDQSVAQRNIHTGHLVVTMPKAGPVLGGGGPSTALLAREGGGGGGGAPSGSGAGGKGARLKPIGGGGGGVNLRGLVRGAGGAEPGGLRAVRTRRLGGGSPPAEDSSSGEEDGGGRGRGGGSDSESGGDDEDQPPPLL